MSFAYWIKYSNDNQPTPFGWDYCKPHHKEAIMTMYSMKEGDQISVPHTQGGMYKATFISSYESNNFFKCMDDYGRTVWFASMFDDVLSLWKEHPTKSFSEVVHMTRVMDF